jgi:hypothetical protein
MEQKFVTVVTGVSVTVRAITVDEAGVIVCVEVATVVGVRSVCHQFLQGDWKR